VRHPHPTVEKQLLYNVAHGFNAADLDTANIGQISTAEQLLEMRECLGSIRVDEGILNYITEIVGKSRSHRSVYLGASPPHDRTPGQRGSPALAHREFLGPRSV
jgi:MoxR-like ATPase